MVPWGNHWDPTGLPAEDEEMLVELKRNREEIGFLSEELQRVKDPPVIATWDPVVGRNHQKLV